MRRFLAIAVVGWIGFAVAACQLYLGQDQSESRHSPSPDTGMYQPDGGDPGTGCCLPDGGIIGFDGGVGDGSPGDGGHGDAGTTPPSDARHHPH
jgi:hypothetical protein